MGILEEINDSVNIAFFYGGEIIAERTWNYIPNVGDVIELFEKKARREFKVQSRRFHDRTEGFFSGLSSQKVTLELVFLGELAQ
jgi:hypothetical protein